MHRGPEAASEAEACFKRSLELSRKQEALAWELRTAVSLSRLWRNLGKREEAAQMLGPVFDKFKKGISTQDARGGGPNDERAATALIPPEIGVMDDTAVARLHYAEEIKFRGQISSLGVLRAFAAVPRELFLHEGPWRIRCDVAPEYWSTADADPVHVYHDVLIAIDERRKLDNGLPSLWARLFDLLDLKANERVVQIGCGLGYYSAILSDLVGPGGKVVAMDCEEAFVRRARRNLRAWENVEVVHGDGCEDVGGPADVIIVHAGFTHPHPLWLKSLRPKGRLLGRSPPRTGRERSSRSRSRAMVIAPRP